MNNTYFHRVQRLTPTRFWINNTTRKQADVAIEYGAVGCTQNPAYAWKMICDEKEKPYVDGLIKELIKQESDDNELLIKLQRILISNVAEHFLKLYNDSGKRMGYVSIQGDPFHEDTETIIRCARFNTSALPNLMAKVPATEEGLKSMRTLLSEGISINATEVMAVRQALDVCSIYNEVCSSMENPPKVYFSHITGIYDEYLKKQVEKEDIDISPDILWHAGMVIARKSYSMAKSVCPQIGFIGGGARGLHHFTEMVGADAVVTINWSGTADKLIEQDPVVSQRFFMPTPASYIDELCEKLIDFKRGYFVNSISPKEYEEFGPVVLFRVSFEEAWKKALNYISNFR